MNIYASYLTDSKISIVNILHVHVVPFLLYPSLDSFANSCVMWTIREVVILATLSELHEGYNLWYLRGDNKKRKKSDTNIWQIYIYIYTEVNMRRVLEMVKGGVSVNVTVERLKIPETRKVSDKLSLSKVSVNHRELLDLPEDVENDIV